MINVWRVIKNIKIKAKKKYFLTKHQNKNRILWNHHRKKQRKKLSTFSHIPFKSKIKRFFFSPFYNWIDPLIDHHHNNFFLFMQTNHHRLVKFRFFSFEKMFFFFWWTFDFSLFFCVFDVTFCLILFVTPLTEFVVDVQDWLIERNRFMRKKNLQSTSLDGNKTLE